MVLAEDLHLLFQGVDQAMAGGRRDHIGPIDELAAIFLRHVEQGGQRHASQFFGHQVDPVKFLADRQAVQNRTRPFADLRGHDGQVHRRHGGRYRLALHIMFWRVHGDEHRQRIHVRLPTCDIDTALGVVRREPLVIGVDRHDVVVFGDRPIGTELVFGAVMDRIFGAKALKDRPHGVGLEQRRLRRVELLKRQRIGLGPRLRQTRQITVRRHGCFSSGYFAPVNADKSNLNRGKVRHLRAPGAILADTGARPTGQRESKSFSRAVRGASEVTSIQAKKDPDVSAGALIGVSIRIRRMRSDLRRGGHGASTRQRRQSR